LKISRKRRLLIAIFLVYLGIVAALTVIPTHALRVRRIRSDHVNIIPLSYSFRCFLQDPNQHPRIVLFCLRNTIGNLLLFIPLGILLPLVSDRFRSLARMLPAALCLSVTIETIQFLSQFVGSPRSVDIDDVLLNTLGACLGFLIYRFSRNQSRQTNPQISPVTRI
jgi:glycopeptide antibiotics resistance protein